MGWKENRGAIPVLTSPFFLESLAAKYPSGVQYVLTLKEQNNQLNHFLILIFPYFKPQSNKSLELESTQLV